jgi:ribosomal protein S18 acetylase RimI-like enzyme
MSPTMRTLHPKISKLSIKTDLSQTADLIDLCFGYQMDRDGHDYLRYVRSVAAGQKSVRWIDGAHERVSVPLFGYVWKEHSRIVGNVSLSPFQWKKKWFYLIANVAVHPDHRRQGIARLLTQQAIYHAQIQGADKVWLHVKEQNVGAVNLYEQLGFQQRAIRNQWRAIEYLYPDQGNGTFPEIHVIPRLRKDWSQHAAWFEESYPSELQWYFGLYRDDIAPGFLRMVERYLLYDQVMHHFSAYSGSDLIGVLSLQPVAQRSHNVYLAIPDGVHQKAAMTHLLRFANRMYGREKVLRVNYPAGQGLEVFPECNFSIQNTLIWMEYPDELFKR